jgi:hypothetical protein
MSGSGMSESARYRIRRDAIFGSSIGLSMLLLALVAVIVPQDVITRNRFLHDYVAVSGIVIPSVEKLAAVSSFPEVTRLVVSLMWTLVPVFTALYLVKVQVPEIFSVRYREKPFFLTFATVVMAMSIVLLAVLFDITPEDLKGGLLNESVLRAVSTSRMGLGFIAGFFSAAIAMMLFVVLVWFFNVPRIYFSNERT